MNVTLPIIGLIVVLWLTRNLWFGFNCAGAYVMVFLMMTYAGVCALALGYDFSTFEPISSSRADCTLALYVATLGLASVLAGLAFMAAMVGRPRRLPKINAWTPLGMHVNRLVFLSVCYTLIFGLMLIKNHDAILDAIWGSFLDRHAYRMSESEVASRAQIQLAYNMLPYVGICGLAFSRVSHRFRRWFFIVFAMGALGRLLLLHKMPLMFYLLLAGAFLALVRHYPMGMRHWFSWTLAARFLVVTVAAGVVLVVLFAYLEDTSALLPTEMLGEISQYAAERILSRQAYSYALIATYIPSRIPHYGLSNIETLMSMVGGRYVPVNELIFSNEFGLSVGSISSDSLANYYGGFGFSGLILLSFFQGTFLAWLDHWLEGRPTTINWFVCLLFMMECSAMLNETHIFGVALGFGGIASLLHAFILAKPTR